MSEHIPTRIDWGGQLYRIEQNEVLSLDEAGRTYDEWAVSVLEHTRRTILGEIAGDLDGYKISVADAYARGAQMDQRLAQLRAEAERIYGGRDIEAYSRQQTLEALGLGDGEDAEQLEANLTRMYRELLDTAIRETVADCYPEEAAAIEEMAEVDQDEYWHLYEITYNLAFDEHPFIRSRGRMVAYNHYFFQIANSVAPDGAMADYVRAAFDQTRVDMQHKANLSVPLEDDTFDLMCATLVEQYPQVPTCLLPRKNLAADPASAESAELLRHAERRQ